MQNVVSWSQIGGAMCLKSVWTCYRFHKVAMFINPAPATQHSHLPDMHKYTQTHLCSMHTTTHIRIQRGRAALNIHRLTSLSLLSLLLFILILLVLLLLLILLFWAHAGGSCDAWQRLAGLERFRVAEGAAVVIEESAEGELIEGVLWVLPVRGAEHVQRRGAVPAVAPRSGAALLLHGVKVGCVHWVRDLGPVRGWLLPKIARKVHLGEKGVSLDLASPVGTQTILRRAAEAADDVNGLWAQFDLGRNLQGALPVNDLQKGETAQTLHRTQKSDPRSKVHCRL